MFVCGRINVGCNQGDWIEKRPGGRGGWIGKIRVSDEIEWIEVQRYEKKFYREI